MPTGDKHKSPVWKGQGCCVINKICLCPRFEGNIQMLKTKQTKIDELRMHLVF